MATTKQGLPTSETVCTICHEPFSNPLELQCGHRFCRDCVEHYAKHRGDSNNLPCPVCRQVCEISAAACETGEKSVTLLKEMGKLEKEKERHRMTCTRHPTDVRYFYCRTCKVFICHNCTVVAHPRDTHEIVDRGDIEQEVKNNAENMMKESKKTYQMIFKHMEDITKCEHDTASAINRIRDSITKAGDDVINRVTELVKSRVQSLLDEANKKQETILHEMKHMKNKSKQLHASIEFAVNKLRDVTQVSLTDESIQTIEKTLKSLDQNLGENINAQRTDFMMRYIAELRFEPEDSSAPNIGRIQEPVVQQEKHYEPDLSVPIADKYPGLTLSQHSQEECNGPHNSSDLGIGKVEGPVASRDEHIELGSISVSIVEEVDGALASHQIHKQCDSSSSAPSECRNRGPVASWGVRMVEAVPRVQKDHRDQPFCYKYVRGTTVLPNGNIAFGCKEFKNSKCCWRGVDECTLEGSTKQYITYDVEVDDIASFTNGSIAVLTKDWVIYLYSSDGKKQDVQFIPPKDCGAGFLTTDHQNNIYVLYPPLHKICMYHQTGGEPVDTINFDNRLNVTEISITRSGEIVARVENTIMMLDRKGRVKFDFPHRHGNCWRYYATDQLGNYIYVVSQQKQSGLVFADEYSHHGKHVQTVILDTEFHFSDERMVSMLIPQPGVIAFRNKHTRDMYITHDKQLSVEST